VTALAQSPDADLARLLRSRGLRVTSQRLVIHGALRDLGRHATAEEVMTAVSDRLPTVSLPTVYSTLELLEELGLVRRVSAGPGPAMWDPRTDQHHHLVCRRCGRVQDLDAELDAAASLDAARRAGFEPERVELVVSGLCDACAA
jgi:Fe2+ or Zn2+ uptake regulation protein